MEEVTQGGHAPAAPVGYASITARVGALATDFLCDVRCPRADRDRR